MDAFEKDFSFSFSLPSLIPVSLSLLCLLFNCNLILPNDWLWNVILYIFTPSLFLDIKKKKGGGGRAYLPLIPCTTSSFESFEWWDSWTNLTGELVLNCCWTAALFRWIKLKGFLTGFFDSLVTHECIKVVKSIAKFMLKRRRKWNVRLSSGNLITLAYLQSNTWWTVTGRFKFFFLDYLLNNQPRTPYNFFFVCWDHFVVIVYTL